MILLRRKRGLGVATKVARLGQAPIVFTIWYTCCMAALVILTSGCASPSGKVLLAVDSEWNSLQNYKANKDAAMKVVMTSYQVDGLNQVDTAATLMLLKSQVNGQVSVDKAAEVLNFYGTAIKNFQARLEAFQNLQLASEKDYENAKTLHAAIRGYHAGTDFQSWFSAFTTELLKDAQEVVKAKQAEDAAKQIKDAKKPCGSSQPCLTPTPDGK